MNGHVDDFEATRNEKGKQSAVEMAGRSAKRAAEIKPRCNDLMVALHCVSVCVTACVCVCVCPFRAISIRPKCR